MRSRFFFTGSVLISFFLLAAGLGSSPPAMITPARAVTFEFTEFELCELELKSRKQVGSCMPARAPGDILTALMDAGRIADPYRDFNSRDAQWVNERAWRYQTTFNHNATPGRRSRLAFMGVDYFSEIAINGHKLGSHEGMFSRLDFDVTDLLNPAGEQRLEITILGVPGDALGALGAITTEFDRRKYLKTQMSFGWDFAPRLKGGGLWDRVFLYESGTPRVRDLFVRPSIDGTALIEVELDGAAPGDGTMQFTVTGEGFDGGVHSLEVPLGSGETGAAGAVRIEDARLWWPWDMGAPDLYRVTVRGSGTGFEITPVSEVFGFREISWGPNPDAPEGSADWVLFINGKREFIRGANWVPAESMYGRMDDSRYHKLIVMARDAGVNCLRMWGGGNRERRAFYDYCDREGILVWQEFPFACVYLIGYPRSPSFRDLVRTEAEEMVRQLRNHPSLIMWCGGNEFNAVTNSQVVETLDEVVTALDPTRRFIPASPYKGDSHNWVVWHMKGNLDDYFDDISPLPSEFGLQAFPARETLAKWISEELLWPMGDVHVHHSLGAAKMEKYVSQIGHTGTLDSYIEASQIMQAHFLQRGIEHWRQRKYRTSGTAFWQLNEPWPAICWSVIDYELTPKLAYHVLKNSYSPLLVSAAYADREYGPGDRFEGEVIIVNDFHVAFPDRRVRANLCGSEVEVMAVEGVKTGGVFDIVPDSVTVVGRIDATVPDDCARPELELDLEDGDARSSGSNLYRLWIYDSEPAGRLNRGLTKTGMVIMSGASQNQWKD